MKKNNPLRWKLPLRHEHGYIFDVDGQMIAQIRGWGHLTGTGGLRLQPDEAQTIQDARGEALANALNASALPVGEKGGQCHATTCASLESRACWVAVPWASPPRCRPRCRKSKWATS